jgi:beta-carotene 15,15'-dioxygenase
MDDESGEDRLHDSHPQRKDDDIHEPQPRFDRWDGRHALGFATTAIAVVAVASAIEVSLTNQLLLLGVLSAVIGLPHGALDWPTARRWLAPRWGWAWAPTFVIAYLAAAAPVALGWRYAPGITLGFFLLTSVYHFAVSDTERSGLAPKRRLLEGLARGLAPVAITSWAWRAEVEMLFGYLAGPRAANVLADAAASAGPVAMVLLVGSAIWRIVDARHDNTADRQQAWRKGIELAALIPVFALLPPLLAFTTYWIGYHWLHVGLLAAAERQGGIVKIITSTFGPAVPVTIATLVLAAVAHAVFFSDRTAAGAAMAVVFMGLSVLNTPHMLFVSLTARYR